MKSKIKCENNCVLIKMGWILLNEKSSGLYNIENVMNGDFLKRYFLFILSKKFYIEQIHVKRVIYIEHKTYSKSVSVYYY